MEQSDIYIDRLAIGYRHGRSGTSVVAQSLAGRVAAGQLTCLVGRNGSGKSTLLRTMAGFLPPLEGTVMIGGEPVAGMSRARLARRVGVVLTSRPDIRAMSVAQTVALGRSPYTDLWGRLSADDLRVVARSLALAGIEGLRDKPMAQLSDGERQKVMVAKALAQQTPVLLLDEPSAFLDYPSKLSLMRLLAILAHDEGKTVLLSTHDVEMAVRHADCIWLLADGQLSQGHPADMMADGRMDSYMRPND